MQYFNTDSENNNYSAAHIKKELEKRIKSPETII